MICQWGIADYISRISLHQEVDKFNGAEKERSKLAEKVKAFKERAEGVYDRYAKYVQPAVNEAWQVFEQPIAPPGEGPSHPVPRPPTTNDMKTNDTPTQDVCRRKRKMSDKHEPTRHEWRNIIDAFSMPLPSDLDERIRSADCMVHPVQCELELRKGYAAEALDSLRVHLMTFATLEDRHKQLSGVKRNTVMDRRMDSKKTSIKNAKQRYRRERELLLTLGLDANDGTFQPLQDEDCKAFVLFTTEETLGDSERVGSWIWGNVGFLSKVEDIGVKDYMIECE